MSRKSKPKQRNKNVLASVQPNVNEPMDPVGDGPDDSVQSNVNEPMDPVGDVPNDSLSDSPNEPDTTPDVTPDTTSDATPDVASDESDESHPQLDALKDELTIYEEAMAVPGMASVKTHLKYQTSLWGCVRRTLNEPDDDVFKECMDELVKRIDKTKQSCYTETAINRFIMETTSVVLPDVFVPMMQLLSDAEIGKLSGLLKEYDVDKMMSKVLSEDKINRFINYLS